ncbi:MAG: phage tail protein [Methanoregula sp.]|jgi:phage tail-like protein|uniref:phage tail protein n=1 Tax=Methanoregula sp. TaxID=2052170 RepID=UPI003C2772B9
MVDRKDPYRNFRFRLEIDGITQAGFNEVIFGNATTEVIEYREGSDPPRMRKLSGLTRYGTIQLKWGITNTMDLYKWYKAITDSGAGAVRKNMSIILVDESGSDKSRWDIEHAWPTRYDPPDFSAQDSRVAIELLEITHEGFQRVQ